MSTTSARQKDVLDQITRALAAEGIPHALAGGMALVAHGGARATKDLDFLVDVEHRDRIDAVLNRLGFFPETLSGDGFARYVRRPLADLPELSEWVDMLYASRDIGRRLLAEAQRSPLDWEGRKVPTVSAAGLVLMKALALAESPERLYDLADIQFLLRAHGSRIDREALRRDAAALGPDVEKILRKVLGDT